jgi:hypothetical protein
VLPISLKTFSVLKGDIDLYRQNKLYLQNIVINIPSRILNEISIPLTLDSPDGNDFRHCLFHFFLLLLLIIALKKFL